MPLSEDSSLVEDAASLFSAAVRSVQADALLPSPENWARQPLSAYDTVRVVGMGKAAMACAGMMEERAPNGIEAGMVVVPDGYSAQFPARLSPPSTIRVIEGGHPLPTEESARAGRAMLQHAREAGAEDLLLVLVSGGGTALSTLPADPLDLADLRTTYQLLLSGGVPIHGANAVRKHLTSVGGGRLARAAAPAAVSAFVISDVVGDDLSTIASGPTVPDPTTFEEAMQVLYRYGLWPDVPAPVRTHLAEGARGRRDETPPAEHPCFEHTQTRLIGSNEDALAAAREEAEARGYTVRRVTSGVEGEARAVGRAHVDRMCEESPDEPTCWLWGGETTVTVTGDGTGGRNQEVALAGAIALEDVTEDVILLSGGTDGIDGPTDAAGAWATPATAEAARAAGCDPKTHLEANDAYPLFDALDQLLRPGPTHTNVMDVHVGLMAGS